MEGKAAEVIANIDVFVGNKNIGATKLMAYYQHNLHRMDYEKYKQIGCGVIDSGAIESTHWTVIQKRMKTIWSTVE